MTSASLICSEENRREDVRSAPLLGFDYVEVSDAQTTLYVYLLGKAPAQITQANLQLSGGARIRDLAITSVRVVRQTDPTLDDYLEVTVNHPGDFSNYTIAAVALDDSGRPTTQPMQGFDPFYAKVCFSFKASCPSALDCQSQTVCPPAQLTQPEISYLAKDYESFRQLILDRLALIMPAWQEEHAPDIGIAIVELLAYVGDYLSYYQDSVATEAYLATARQRISVRRHARLVDYTMHEGCNARAWLTIGTDTDQQLDPAEIFFITGYPAAPASHILTAADLINVSVTSYEVFEVLAPAGGAMIQIRASHSEIHFYTWGNCRCCLPAGTTMATLVDAWVPAPGAESGSGTGTPPDTGNPGLPSAPAPQSPRIATHVSSGTDAASASGQSDGPPGTVRTLHLAAGDLLIFEEVRGPKTGNAADADVTHRQAVRLTRVTPAVDTLYKPDGQSLGQPVLEIEWSAEDALTFPLCISSQNPAPDCGCMEDVSVARGNVILVDHGASTTEVIGTVGTESTTPSCPGCCRPASIEILPQCFSPVLGEEPLTWSQPLADICSASGMIVQDPRLAMPRITLSSAPPAPALSAAAVEPLFTFDDLAAPTSIAKAMLDANNVAAQFLLHQLSATTRQLIAGWDSSSPLPSQLAIALTADLTALLTAWSPVADLLESQPDAKSFVIETDNDGFGHLRFGDGILGEKPPAGAEFRADYRVGSGTSGNVGRETINFIVFRHEKLSGVNLTPRNPLAATGGTDPEPMDEVRRFAPYAFSTVLERAITADDYATLAEDNGRRLTARDAALSRNPKRCTIPFVPLQAAKAALRWNGSWYTAFVALDPQGSETAPATLTKEVGRYLEPYRRMGHDLLVAAAEYVPLKVTINVCILPDYLQGHVEAAILAAVGNGMLPDGTLGFFHPDRLSFGDGVYVSQLTAAVQAIPGVRSVKVVELERLTLADYFSPSPASELPANSALALGPLEIARLDNDPNFPENGVLILNLRGGR